jgi:hypothetical protein
MLSNEKFLNSVLQNAERVTHYQSGESGAGGGCDCIGLIIGALRLAGVKWSGTHGSNYAARNEMRVMNPLKFADQLRPGHLVYKGKAPGQSGYALPSKYASHIDKTDYYHVGVVVTVNPLKIVHCTSVEGGIKWDSSIGNWNYYGELDKVGLPEGDDTRMTVKTMYVTSENGGKVKFRMNPNTNAGWYASLDVGTEVTVHEYESATWYKISYGGNTGFMMKQFLCDTKPTIYSPVEESDDVTLTMDRATAEKLLALLQEALG